MFRREFIEYSLNTTTIQVYKWKGKRNEKEDANDKATRKIYLSRNVKNRAEKFVVTTTPKYIWSKVAHLWRLFFFLSHFPFILPYFSQCKWDRNGEERDELPYMKYAIAIQRTLSFCIHFIYSAIVNIVIMNYFTLLLVSHLCGAPILFFHFGWFALRIASVTILLLRCYVWWIFFYCYFHFSILRSQHISLHFPFFVRSIHQAQIHAYPIHLLHTHRHKHPRTDREHECHALASPEHLVPYSNPCDILSYI